MVAPALGTARFALLNIADSNGHIDLPSSSMAWKNIHAAAEGLDRYCVVNQHGVGGSWVLIGMFDSYISASASHGFALRQ